MSNDTDMVMLSALQHYLFCPRQCALIHVEGLWSENYLTSAGRRMHERVDSGQKETRRGVHLATSLRLVSNRLNMLGVADLVEFHLTDNEFDDAGRRRAARLPGREGWWRPFPVEYKRGSPKGHRADEVQLCAQAICLEEMLKVTIAEGALFYGEPRRRVLINFDNELRLLTKSIVAETHKLIKSGVTPPACYSKACEACSLKEVCRPREVDSGRSVRQWVESEIARVASGEVGHG